MLSSRVHADGCLTQNGLQSILNSANGHDQADILGRAKAFYFSKSVPEVICIKNPIDYDST